MKHVFSLGSCLLLLLCASALAQTPAPTQRIRGDVVAIAGSNLQVKARSGETLTVFNISGNEYRLIARIRYDCRLVNVRIVLTHAEYDKGKWKE